MECVFTAVRRLDRGDTCSQQHAANPNAIGAKVAALAGADAAEISHKLERAAGREVSHSPRSKYGLSSSMMALITSGRG